MSDIPNTALSVVSSNFESRKVEQIDENTVRIKPTVGSLAFCLVFFLTGTGLLVAGIVVYVVSHDGRSGFVLVLLGALFAAIGIAIYRSSNQQLILNRDTGAAFIRSWQPSVPLDTALVSRHIQAQDIVAIQVVSRTISRKSRGRKKGPSYVEHQVNLCTSDDERYNAFITLKKERADVLAALLANLFDAKKVTD